MSNTDNIYNILNNFNKIAKDAPAPVAATPKAKTKLQESMEQVVNEKYMGFKKTVAAGKKLGEGQDMMKNFFVILDDSLIDQIANMDGAEVDPDAGTVETWNENTARQLAAFAQKNPNRLQRKQSMNTAGMKPMAQRADGSSTGPEYGLKEDKKLNEKAANPYAVGMAVAKKKAGITAKPAHDLPKKVVKKAHEIAKKIDEGQDATTYTVAYKDPKKPGKSHSTQVKATSAAEAKAAFQEWDTTNRFTYLGSRPDVDKVYEDHGPENPDAPVNYGEYDREGDMAKDDLYTIDSAAEELYSILQADENLPEWVQSKITKAVDYIDTARDYMKAQSYGQGMAEDQLDEIGNTPAGKDALRAVQNRAYDTMDAWSKNSASGFSATPKQVKRATGAATAAGNRLHGFGPDRMNQNTVMARDALRKDMAEGADFSAADKVEELVRYYKLFDKRGWTDLFAKLAGRKLQGVPEISREMEYASKFLDLLDSIRMRSDYRGQQDPKKDQELIDLSNQWLDLLNQAEDEFKTMSGQGMAEGSSENKYSNLSNRGVNRGINRAGDDFNRMMDLDQVESPHYKTQHQQDTKQRLKTKPMAGPKGVLPEQGMSEGEDSKEIGPGWKTEHGIVDKVEGNSVIVKTSKGKMRVNMHDIKTAEAPEQGVAEARFPTVADARKRAEQEKGTGKFTSKKNPDHPSGTIYTRKYNPKSGETDDTENVSTEKRGRGRPKKSAFEDMSTIDKMIAESFGELFEGTSRPVGDPVSKAAPTAPGVGSGIRVTPMPALATPKPATTAPGVGSIQGGVWTAKPPKPGQQGVPVPQGLDEVDAEMEGMRKLAGLKGGQKKLDRDHDGKLTGNDFSMLRKGLEEGGSDDYDEIRDKIQWLQGAPNYLSRDEAKETAYYTKDTDPVWAGYRDDDEISERVTIGPDGKVTGGFQPSTAPDTPEQAARRQQSLQAYQAQQQAQNKPSSFASDVDSAKKGLYMKPGDNTVYSGTRGPGPSMAADRLEKRGVDIPGLVGNRVNPDNIVDEVDDMEEGNAFSGAVARAKADGVQPGEKISVGGKEYDLKEGDAALNQMRRIAGLKECGMSPISGAASDMQDEQGNMNISTNQNSDGTKSVTITAAGDAASSLMQMLKLAGMGGGAAAPAAAAEPEIVVVAQDGEEAMEEEKDPRYQASTTPDEQVAPVQALTKGGNGDVAGQEKEMKPGGYQFGDNNLAMQESLSTQLMKEYNSIKVKK